MTNLLIQYLLTALHLSEFLVCLILTNLSMLIFALLRSGIADDKAIYTYLPEIIKFYLGEEPILENVKTWRCYKNDEMKYVLNNLNKLVVKEVHGSGGYGLMIGSKSSKKEIESFRKKSYPNLKNLYCPTYSSTILSTNL